MTYDSVMEKKFKKINHLIDEIEVDMLNGIDAIRKNHSADEQLEIFEFMIEKLTKAQNETK